MPGSQSNKHSLPPLVRIMVVEPDSDMKSLLYDFLSSLGLQVQAFSSATEALGALRTARDLTLSNPHERYSFLLMQTHLRDFLPHRFFIEAKALFPELFVILTSTGSRTTLDHLRKSWGANASLLQPIALDELEKIVKTKFV